MRRLSSAQYYGLCTAVDALRHHVDMVESSGLTLSNLRQSLDRAQSAKEILHEFVDWFDDDQKKEGTL